MKTQQILRKIFEHLKQLNEQRSSKLVLVYLPTPRDLTDESSQRWMTFLEQESKSLEIPLINIVSAFQTLSYDEAIKMFIPEGQLEYRGAAGHLNHLGNEFTAKMIAEKLLGFPVISRALVPDSF